MVNILIEALLVCVYVEAKQRFVYFSLYLADFPLGFSSMVWFETC